MPFGLGWPELVIILVIVLVIFGASRVPEIGRALGKGIREFRGSVAEVKEGVEGKAAEPASSGEQDRAESTPEKSSS